MEIKEISPDEFRFKYPSRSIYNSVDFAELNKSKAEALQYLSVEDRKPRFGIILGERGNSLLSPFSAPFGGFVCHGKQRLEYMDEAVRLLVNYAKARDKSLVITPPSMVYDQTEMSKWINIYSNYLKTRFVDLNYHFSTARFSGYEEHIERNARKNLCHALREDFHFVKLDSASRKDVARAYDVIRRNRTERGFPLRMTLEQVWQTVSQVVDADFFILENEGNDVAAAQVFHVTEDMAQVVYWGDVREYSAMRPMNMLTYKVFEYYHNTGIKILDIGISTENGIPNFGLCEFKESIGCEVTLKYSFEI